MKILNLIIYNETLKTEIRNISFNEKGVSFIYGDIDLPHDGGKSINSLGKTILLKIIDTIYGSNSIKNLFAKWNNGVLSANATILFKNNKYIIKRYLNSKDHNIVYVNNIKMTLAEYKQNFNLNRKNIARQIMTMKKNSNLGLQLNVTVDDISFFLTNLGFTNLAEYAVKMYELKKEYKKDNNSEIKLDLTEEEIDADLYIVNNSISNLINKNKIAENNIKNINFYDAKIDLSNEYESKNTLFKDISLYIAKLEEEKKKLNEFINDSSKVNLMSSEDIFKIYSEANSVLPDVVKRRFSLVENFYKESFLQRKDKLEIEIQNIDEKIQSYLDYQNRTKNELKKIQRILNENKIYRENILILQNVANKLTELETKKAQLEVKRDIYISLNKTKNEIKKTFDELKEKLDKEFESIYQNNSLQIYRDFITSSYNQIYDDNLETVFQISKEKNFKITSNNLIPVKVDISINKDDGEARTEIKK
ncbi:hypothetical protein, partial [Mycoplasmopsis primatum]|uniref:hypothetical protein n=1 Tax=Mycoplasmopsis primatum TaxID=55604 RepID=UPI0004978D1A